VAINLFNCMAVITLFTLSCAYSRATVSAVNVTFPVSVGPVKNIGGSAEKEKQRTVSGTTFTVSVDDMFSVSHQQLAQYSVTEYRRISEGSNKVDAEIMKNARQGDRVDVLGIRIGSWGFWPIVVLVTNTYAGVEGVVYPEQKNIGKGGVRP